MSLEINKVHEDARRSIHIIKDLLPGGKEFSIININKGKAIGGCYHTQDEHWVVIQGLVEIWTGDKKIIANTGDSGLFPANTPHAFVALMDSIISEWGITTEEKERDVKDAEMRKHLDLINE